ncbi:hypothetical protein [Nannocystis punicea]|uniref:Cysteine rich repeat-containing protein n=1 Tax=Nannocystis punicea TaxID=2995304 RepID=A0ABY7GS24_9BACT|nr:hypothetical protein [Nannocystis poenicansa]WAS89732.1 hypothetical protein O0S08_26365 [Nannocystis poenicansa]
MPRLTLVLAVLGAFAGCYADVDAFSARMAEIQCKQIQTCRRAQFDEQYEDLDHCAEKFMDLPLEPSCYESEAGSACVRAYRRHRHDCQLESWLHLEECEAVARCYLFASEGEVRTPDVLRSDD